MSYEGFGKSTRPADGGAVTAQRMLEQAGKVLEWIRRRRGVPRVDVFGTSIGAGIAIALGGVESPIARAQVGRLVVSTTVYKVFTPEAAATYTPAFKEFLLGQPGGYPTTTPAHYVGAFAGMDPAAVAWANATIPGQYPVGPTLEIFELPFFEAAPGRAPLLQLWGDANPLTPLADPQRLEQEYGGPYERVIYEGAGHSPMTEPVRHQFWDDVEAYLDEGTPAVSVCDLVDGL